MDDKLLIGFAEETLTPDGKTIALAGQFYDRISQYVETPITATAMIVQKGEEQMTIVSTDMTAIAENIVEGVRENTKDLIAEGFDPRKIIINATHTHTSHTYPRIQKNLKGTVAGGQILNKFMEGKASFVSLTEGQKPTMDGKEALAFIIAQCTKAVRGAWANRHPAGIRFGFGRAAVGMCRRVVYDDGSAKMWGDTNHPNFREIEGGNDSGIEIGYVFDEGGKLEGIIANVACPSQILEHRSFISSDYWGKVKLLLREKFGDELKLIALCSPAGDMCPRDLVRWVNPETPINDPNIHRPDYIERTADPSMFDIKGTWRAGKRIFHEIVDAMEDLQEIDPAEVFRHEVFTVDLPYRRVTVAEYEKAVAAIEAYVDKNKTGTFDHNDSAMMHVHAGTVARFENQKTREIFPVEIHVVRFGNVAFATNPFELFLDYGNQIRARSRAKQTFLIQLANGAFGYLPTEKAEKGSHYSAYVSSGNVGHEGGDLLVRKTTAAINELFRD